MFMDSSRNTLIICATVMFCFVTGGIIAVARYTTGSNTLALAGIMVTLLGSTIAGLAALFKVDKMGAQVAAVGETADRVMNGELTAKIKTVVGEALTEHARKP